MSWDGTCRIVEREVVQSFDGLYDEKSEAVLHDINNRRLCLGGHDWINGSLQCNVSTSDGRERSIRIEAYEHRLVSGQLWSVEWGTGYGGIRYCTRCKVINCIHIWDWQTTYVVELGKFYEQTRNIAHCVVCKKRIARSGSNVCKPSVEACAILNQIAEELGKPPLMPGNYGSGFLCELPVAVSNILDASGEDAARDFAFGQLRGGDCHLAMHMVAAETAKLSDLTSRRSGKT